MLNRSCPQYISASPGSSTQPNGPCEYQDQESSMCPSSLSLFHTDSNSLGVSIADSRANTSVWKMEEGKSTDTLHRGASGAVSHHDRAAQGVLLSDPYHLCRETPPQLGSPPKRDEERVKQLTKAVRTILECVGEDPDREGLRATPERYAEAMLFFTKGYLDNVQDLINGAVFHENYDELIIVRDIDVFSLCEHHIAPFTGKMHIGYIPDGRVLGISKLARLAEMFSRRLQIQERLTKQVAMAISDALKPRGVGVIMEASHLCMVMRGVQKVGSTTTTSYMVGCMRSSAKTREEFMALLNQK